jgi:hypothetical protein
LSLGLLGFLPEPGTRGVATAYGNDTSGPVVVADPDQAPAFARAAGACSAMARVIRSDPSGDWLRLATGSRGTRLRQRWVVVSDISARHENEARRAQPAKPSRQALGGKLRSTPHGASVVRSKPLQRDQTT